MMNMNEKKYNVYSQHCPSRFVLEIISDKWTILIIDKLSQKTCRFGELKREIGGVSQKVLTQTLKSLEKNGLIKRESYPVLPLKVEYSLTPLGVSISSIFSTITTWAESHIDEIMLAQSNYQTQDAE
jgi:DNA-binding HxlR family transcriptional regulator